LAGCGGSGETSSTKQRSSADQSRPSKRSPAEKPRTPRTPAERARFIKQGNAICRRADAEQQSLAAQYLKKRRPLNRRWEIIEPALLPAMRKELQELRALKPPEGEEAEIQRILLEMEKGIKDADYDPIDLVYTWSDPFSVARHLAKRYGLKVCAFSSEVLIQPREEQNGF